VNKPKLIIMDGKGYITINTNEIQEIFKEYFKTYTQINKKSRNE
jgi:hypothetical protein